MLRITRKDFRFIGLRISFIPRGCPVYRGVNRNELSLFPVSLILGV